ncbi:type II secretion system minor pseudopilin GspJ [Spongiibacter sp. KMU-158]|uniref:Type II secretion system protein J n=1 Tax=Spongiibacter pelagi TaxID=2760804 RepID=A0A927C2B1_9GAMM|nr:type II secretion system minor pseudopilin GspJ [Spongiibacter pelagi]MBD2858552.1 type II secretion system minor pseudopilin GspJ [Spongiibacter pelagi]
MSEGYFKIRRLQRGFTLVELLIAVAIMALLGSLAGFMLNSSLNNKERIELHQQRLEELALALQIIRRDFEQLTPRIPRDQQGDPFRARIRAEQIGEHSEVEFVHGGRRILPGQILQSDLERVRYQWEDGSLVRYSAAVADPTTNTEWQRQLMLDDVSRFVVEFYYEKRWTSFWPPNTQISATQPDGVRVVMDVAQWPDITMNILLPEIE